MDDDTIRDRLSEHLANSLAGPIPESTPRLIHGQLTLPHKATAVIGMRRAGKTTFLHQIRGKLVAAGTPRHLVPYLNFEDEQLATMEARDLGHVLEVYYRRHPETRGDRQVTWCFDEIQVVPGWERFVRRIIDSERVQLFLSGSSATLLSRELATSMRGRAWEVLIHPFSFREYLAHSQVDFADDVRMLDSSSRSVLERSFADYLLIGGFPEAQGLDAATRHRLLSDYVDVAVLRDIIERHGVRNIAGLRWMVRQLLGNAAGLFSVEKFYRALKSQGIAIAKDTVHEFLAHLEDCFLVRTVWLDAGSERRRMVNPRKVYPIDPGLIRVFDRTDRANLGHALETVIYLELERRGYHLSYVRTGDNLEVDFIARKPGVRDELIQVCADPGSDQVLERELRSLAAARKQYPRANTRLLSAFRLDGPTALPAGVVAQPAYEWLLSGDA
jgi:predicted AAA+ superfamily ATPase